MESKHLDIILKRLYVAENEDGGERLTFDVHVVQEKELHKAVTAWFLRTHDLDLTADGMKEDLGPLRGCFICKVETQLTGPPIKTFKLMFDHVVFEDVEASRIEGGFFRINDNVKFCSIPGKALPFPNIGLMKMCVYAMDFEGALI